MKEQDPVQLEKMIKTIELAQKTITLYILILQTLQHIQFRL